MQSKRVLTGITTSGTPHLGNYAGAIRPAIQASTQPGVDAFFFLADYHALVKCDDPARVAQSRLQIAATWLAAGLDAERVTFYRQSDIAEIPELCWMLTCITAKGLMNRAHAYKAAVDANLARGEEPDDGVNMGLFSYPILMAADILMFNAHSVPVGRDQIQHLEMARDIAQRFNHMYGQGRELFVAPQVQIDSQVATLPGLDGRKMSKSYNNTIPLFEGGATALQAAIAQIVTDSRAPGEPKQAEGSALLTIYQAFATREQTQDFQDALTQGMGWGQAKQELYALIEAQLAPLRARYFELMARPQQIEDILQAGAAKARAETIPFMQILRAAVGLRPATSAAAPVATGQEAAAGAAGRGQTGKSTRARLVSFKDEDGLFRQRLLGGAGQQLLLSEGFGDPKVLNSLGRSFATIDLSRLPVDAQGYVALQADGLCWARVPQDQLAAVAAALASL